MASNFFCFMNAWFLHLLRINFFDSYTEWKLECHFERKQFVIYERFAIDNYARAYNYHPNQIDYQLLISSSVRQKRNYVCSRLL
jgi:hypothetical protein